MKQNGINFLPTISTKLKQPTQILNEKDQNIENIPSKFRLNRVSKNSKTLTPLGILPQILNKKNMPLNKLSSVSLSMHAPSSITYCQESIGEKYDMKRQLKVNKQKLKNLHQDTKIKRIGKLNPTKAISIYVDSNNLQNSLLSKSQINPNNIQKPSQTNNPVRKSINNKNNAGSLRKKSINQNKNMQKSDGDGGKQLNFAIKKKQKMQNNKKNWQLSSKKDKDKSLDGSEQKKLHQYTYNIVISYISRKSEQITVVNETYKHFIHMHVPKNEIDPIITYRTSETYSQTKSIRAKTNSQTKLELPISKKGKKHRKKSKLQSKRSSSFSKYKQHFLMPAFKAANSARSCNNESSRSKSDQNKYNKKIPIDETPHIQFRSHPYLENANISKNDLNSKILKSKQLPRVSINHLLEKQKKISTNQDDSKIFKNKSRFSKQLKINKFSFSPQQ